MTSLEFGAFADGTRASFPLGEGHLAITGRVGSGMSVAARAIICQALDAGAKVHVIDLVKAGSDFLGMHGTLWLHTDLQAAHMALLGIAAELDARRADPARRGAPLLLVVEHLESLTLPTGDETEDRRSVREALCKLLGHIISGSARMNTSVVVTGHAAARPSVLAPLGLWARPLFGHRLLMGNAKAMERIVALDGDRAAEQVGPDTPRGSGVYQTPTDSGRIVQVDLVVRA